MLGFEEGDTSTVPTPIRPWDKGNKIMLQSPLITTGMTKSPDGLKEEESLNHTYNSFGSVMGNRRQGEKKSVSFYNEKQQD